MEGHFLWVAIGVSLLGSPTLRTILERERAGRVVPRTEFDVGLIIVLELHRG